MRAVLPLFAATLPSCLAPWGGPPSDDLEPSWKEDIAENHRPTGEGAEFTGAPVDDPSGIEGLHHVAQETDDCLIRYDMEGTRTDCSGCDYAFDVVLEVNFNDCGGSASTLTSRFEFSRDRLYIDGRYMAAFIVDGPFVEWSGSGTSSYYDYYGYYYEYYYGEPYGGTAYYGRALLLR